MSERDKSNLVKCPICNGDLKIYFDSYRQEKFTLTSDNYTIRVCCQIMYYCNNPMCATLYYPDKQTFVLLDDLNTKMTYTDHSVVFPLSRI